MIPELPIGRTIDEFPGGTINKLIRDVNQLMAQRLPRRGGGGGDRVHYVAITESFTGATWLTDVATAEEITVFPFSGGTISDDHTEIIRVGGPVVVTITAGKFKRAIVLGRDLMNVFCEEWDLPSGWSP